MAYNPGGWVLSARLNSVIINGDDDVMPNAKGRANAQWRHQSNIVWSYLSISKLLCRKGLQPNKNISHENSWVYVASEVVPEPV